MIPQNPPLRDYVVILAIGLAAGGLAASLQPRLAGRRLATAHHRLWDGLAAACLAIYTVAFTVLSLRQQAALQTTWDLALYSSVLWNTLHGRFLVSSLLNDAVNYFGTHFTPILLLFLPLYAVWDQPTTLLVLQTLLLALGGVPAYLLAAQRLGHKGWGLLFLLAYLLHPGLQYTNLDQFHGMALLAPLLMWGLYFLLNGRTALFVVCVALMWGTREDAPIITLMLGLYAWLALKRPRLGLVLASASLVWGLLAVLVVVPAFRLPDDYPHAVTLYSYLGGSPATMARTVLTHPGIVLRQILQPSKLSFVASLWAPVGLLCLLSPALLAVSLPNLAILLLSSFWTQTSVEYHYAAPLVPIAVMAALLGTRWLLHRKESARWAAAAAALLGTRWLLHRKESARWAAAAAAYLLACSLGSYLLLGPGPLGGRFDPTRFQPDSRSGLMAQAIAQVGSDEALLVNRRFYPQVTQRQHLFTFPDPRPDLPVDAILLDTLGPETAPPSYPYVLAAPDDAGLPLFQLVWEQDDVRVWRRSGQLALDRPANAQFVDAAGAPAFTLLRWGQSPDNNQPLRAGETLDVAMSWRAEEHPDQRYAFFVHLVDLRGETRLWAQADQEPAGGLHPTTLWPAGQLFADHYQVHLPADMPPGDYDLIAGVYNADTVQPLRRAEEPGTVAWLGKVRVEAAAEQ